MNNAMITWSAYRGDDHIFNQLTNINEFALIVDIPPVPEIADPVVASKMSSAIYDSLATAVGKAKFFSEDEIGLVSGPNKCGATYNDDRFDFGLHLESSRLVLHREGSRFKDFHEWYTSLMPHVPVLSSSVLDMLKTTTRRECKVLRAGFVFKFLLHDLIREGDKEEAARQNSEIMARLVRGVPSSSGRLSQEAKDVASTSRTDVNITRWVERQRGPQEPNWRLERYLVEAPANKRGAGLWLTFGYGGETYSLPDGNERIGFSGREFMSEWDTAYIDFLRDKAIAEFLATLTEGYTFETSAGSLP